MMDILLSVSEWESSSESGSSDRQEEIDYLYGGQAANILSNLEESIGKIDDFLSFDRGFTHGDIVCSVKDPSGQTGRVINVNLFVDLENIHGNNLSDVNSKNILKIRSISVGDYVVLGAWLGRVDRVVDFVTVVFDDGSKCEVIAADQEKLLPIFSNVLEDSQYPYYPGQRVKARLSKFSKSVTWSCGTWRDYQVEGTVCEVDAGVVYVDWLASALMGSDLNLAAPPRLQNSKNLTLLSDFSYANWQLGDWCMLPAADSKVIVEPTFISSTICDKKKLKRGLKRRNFSSCVAEIFVIVKTKSKVDVLWQDGSCSLDLDSQTLLPVSIVNSHEFWPEQFVLEKGIYDDPHISNGQRWGVVRVVDAKEKTVTVQWIKVINETSDSDKDQTVETLSAYGLVEHPDYTYCYGDVVFKLAQNQFDTGKEEALEGKNCAWDQNDCPDKHYLSCIGIVAGFKDGAVEVRWATGFTTKVGPNEIYGIEKYEGSAETPVLHEDNVEELNQEIPAEQYSIQEEMNLLNFNGGEVCKKYPWESSSFSFPRAAIGFFTSIATSLFGYLGSTSESGSQPSVQMTKDANQSEILLQKVENHDICCEPCPIDLLTLGKTNLNQEVEENLEKEELQVSTALGKSDNFRQFDMVSDCSDHHFFGASKGLALSQVKRAWVKKVQQEWSILERTLPETIYVRIYEDRMDLIRAAIIGAPGTPYHDGLFFFDIFLPPEYPHEPPLVHYISGGLQVNPNLYESGKVCLSLLNTWSGTGSEVWNPGSTILQVLLSLQALVLNEKPYFNEAGYDKLLGRAEGEKNSDSYNENAFLVTCQSMLYLLHKPPKHFKELVEEHFTLRSTYILWACKAYMEGAPVGSAFGCKEDGENSKGCSTGFKIMLAKLFPKLVETFSGNGIDCSQFTEAEK